MTIDKYNIRQLAAVIRERCPRSSDDGGTKFTTKEIIKALLEMAENGEFPVSFASGSSSGEVHLTKNDTAYQSEIDAANAAETRDDLQGIHYEIIKVDGGWGIHDLTTGFTDWFEYWTSKDTMSVEALGETMLLSIDDWNTFKSSSFFREWIERTAPLTDEQMQSLWPPGGLTTDAQRRGGSQSRCNPWLNEALGRIVIMLNDKGISASCPAVWKWLEENASSYKPYEFDPPIPGCEELYVDGDELMFTEQETRQNVYKRRSLERYVARAIVKNPPNLTE